MNKKNLCVSLLIGGMLGMSVPAYAEGELDGQWFSTRIKTTIKKYHSIKTEGADSLNDVAVKFDSGKNCYTGLKWMGQGSQLYYLVTICQGQNGWVWDTGDSAFVDGSIDNSAPELYEMNDGSLANEVGGINVPPANSVYPSLEGAFYLGTLVLKASFKPDHSIKDVKLIAPKDGTVYYRNEAQKIFGTGPSGLTMKRVDSSKVPAEAKACFDSVIGGSLVTNCPVGDWVTPN